MANAFYDEFKPALGQGLIDLLTDTIQVLLVDTAGYTFDAAHTSANLPTPVAQANLASKTISAAGAFDAADVVFSALTGASIEAVILYDSTAGKMIAYLDDTSLQFTPNGNDATLSFNASGIFTF